MANEKTKTTIHQQTFKIILTMRGINAVQTAQTIASCLSGGAVNREAKGSLIVVDYLERFWTITSSGDQSEGNVTVVSAPLLAYEDIDEFMCLVEELKDAGAQGGEDCGIRFFACMEDQPVKAIANLKNIVASKSYLLGKAFQCDFSVEEERLMLDDDDFVEVMPCGLASNLDLGEMKACIQLGCAISAQAINQSRASSMVQHPENERYAFRCWLNRMGLKGAEYKPMRMRLLKRLEGDSSFKDGRKAA